MTKQYRKLNTMSKIPEQKYKIIIIMYIICYKEHNLKLYGNNNNNNK